MEKPVVLIIDDDPNLRKTLSDILRAKGHETHTAKSGEEGIALLARHAVNVALIDLRLPDISGLEVLERVRADHPHTEAIILTGNATLDSAIEATNKGAFSYLQKPYDIEQLMLHIRRAIEKQQAEKTIRERTAQLEAVNKELESFAYVVSHDLKAPLRGVASLSNWLMADYADKLGEEGRQSLNLLVSRVTRMNDMIDGILHYSRVGRIKEELVEVDLKPMLDELIDMLTVPTHIEIKVETEMPTIACEKTRIFQVFQNLLSNAVKYMDKPKGMIRIGCLAADSDSSEFGVQSSETKPSSSSKLGILNSELKTIPHSALRIPHSKDDYWTFYVADNGPGIEAQYFEKIFQIFQTLKPRDELESTGVGLTIAKKIVELQGGKIWVESKPGEGSAFWFTIAKKQIEKDKNSQSEKFNVVESEGAK